MQAVPVLEFANEDSPLEAARTSRGLSREDAAERAALTADEVTWLEEGRLYRFRSQQQAVAALVTYAAALRIDHREALELAGRPVPPADPARTRARLLAGLAIVFIVLMLAAALTVGRLAGGNADQPAAAQLPPPWRVSIDVLNGSGDIEHTRNVADRINALEYLVRSVRRASRFDYPETAVYYPPGAKPLADRLAAELCVPTKPLPAGKDKRRLVVIVGPARAVPDADC
ncbi:MAG: helix-turn-helix domain-containing protein [Actinomycetota bacterium]|nr:helix-turn-helix domain-containing protein [Actinomycetota bacterium]